ncbi:MAG: class I SAM-dependent methyltransferase [Cyanobacteria bacterium]|nr:class I SAM-dependent methyltransferase [Cyanobacteriota bacterium]
MKLYEIGQFYGERKGWRMFDYQFLTPEVRSYLSEEEEFLLQAAQGRYQRVIEVGCGYGRYMNWALSRGFHYVGLDIVPWLVELGQLRTVQAQRSFPSLSAKIILHPAEKIYHVVADLTLNSREHRSLAFFPFNCLGNVSQFEAALDSLRDSKVDVVVSTFKTDATATKTRKAYYQNCGYERLNSRILREGLLMISDEGFHAMAYHYSWLVSAFQRRGFELNRAHQTESVGSIYYFVRGDRVSTGEIASEKVVMEAGGTVEVILFVLEDPPTASAELLRFKETKANLKLQSTDCLEGECFDYLAPGTVLRVSLPVVPQNTSDPPWYLDLVGEITNCSERNDGTPVGVATHKVMIKLSKSEPALLDAFSN